MILLVIIGYFVLKYVYDNTVIPMEYRLEWDKIVREYEKEQRNPNRFAYDSEEPDLDLLCNKVIDIDEAFK